MLHEEKKVAKIVEELTVFFFGLGATDMNSSIKVENEVTYICFKSNYPPEVEHKLKRMESFLNAQKNEGVADIYWELAGSGDPGETSQLLLIGMMVNKAVITKEGNYVTIELETSLS